MTRAQRADGGWDEPRRRTSSSAALALTRDGRGPSREDALRARLDARAARGVPRRRSGRPSACRAGATRRSRGYLHAFATVPAELDEADAALQWCGRELERGFRTARFGAGRGGATCSCAATRSRAARHAHRGRRGRARAARSSSGRTAASARAAAEVRATCEAALALRHLAPALGSDRRRDGPATAAPCPMLNLAAIHEAIAAAIPDRECLVFRDRRLTLGRRHRPHAPARRRAARRTGSAAAASAPALANWESGQDHVALYLYNGNEYLEGMLGAFKARCVPFNVNYRYVDEELVYLFDERGRARGDLPRALRADARAHPRAAPARCALWLQVDDDSGEPLLPGALDYEARARRRRAARRPQGLSPDDLYMLYTGGTTGMPKGVLWRQEDIFRAALYAAPRCAAHRRASSSARSRRRARARCPRRRSCTAPRTGSRSPCGTSAARSSCSRTRAGSTRTTSGRRSSASASSALTIVGDAFGAAARSTSSRAQALRRLARCRLLTLGRRDPHRRAQGSELLELLPGVQHPRRARLLGERPAGVAGLARAGGTATTGNFELAAGQRRAARRPRRRRSRRAAASSGWLARSGAVPLGYYQRRREDGAHVPRDRRRALRGARAIARSLEPDGRLRLLGRDSVTINTGGEKVFAEEVEHALKHHPAVYDAVVVGTPHERFGQQVTALVALRAGATPDEEALRATVRAHHIARYKLPARVPLRRRDRCARRAARPTIAGRRQRRSQERLSAWQRASARQRVLREARGCARRSRRGRPGRRATSSARRRRAAGSAGRTRTTMSSTKRKIFEVSRRLEQRAARPGRAATTSQPSLDARSARRASASAGGASTAIGARSG